MPAAAIAIDRFDADFYSIGSNDLTQYVMAAARDIASLSDYADAADPAVLSLIARTVEHGKRTGREVSLCGDAASDPRTVPHLLDAGLRSLSVSASSVGLVKAAIAGALLASMNTASEYGFGGVIAALPGFLVIADALKAIPHPLVNEAITVTTLAGITGSASGGMSIALAAMADNFIAAANAAGIPMEVLHRVASMASGGMDTLPHNGAVITLLAVTGLTHREAYGGVFKITLIKTVAVFFVIALYYLTGLV